MQFDLIFDQDLQESQFIPQSQYETYEKMLNLSTESNSQLLKPEDHSLLTFGSQHGSFINNFDFNLANSSKRPIQPFMGLMEKKISIMGSDIFTKNQKNLQESWASTNFSQNMFQNTNEDNENIFKKEQIQIEKDARINHTKFLLRMFFRSYDEQLANISQEERQKLGLITRRIRKIKYKSKSLNLKLMKELFGDEKEGKNSQIKAISRKLLHRIIRTNTKANILGNNHLQTKKSTMILTKITALRACNSALIKTAKGNLSIL